jgi:molybdenum-dependent DNA-binding transcriptional regulator ModE
MSTNFASLGIEVNSSQAVKAADDLDKLVDSAVDAEKAIDDLGKTGSELADTGKKIVQAEREVAQEIDKSTGATQRQADARRKSGASATSEIAIISQLDKAMSGNIDSMEQLVPLRSRGAEHHQGPANRGAGVGEGGGEAVSHKRPTEPVTISGFFMGDGVNPI